MVLAPRLLLEGSLRAAAALLRGSAVAPRLRALAALPLRRQRAVPVADHGEWRVVGSEKVTAHMRLRGGLSLPRVAFGTGCQDMDDGRFALAKCGGGGGGDKDEGDDSECRARADAVAQEHVTDALAAGFRLLDTAALYGNAALIGRAIREAVRRGVLRRAADVLVSTKVGLGEYSSEESVRAGDGGIGPAAVTELRRQQRLLGVPSLAIAMLHHSQPYTPEQVRSTQRALRRALALPAVLLAASTNATGATALAPPPLVRVLGDSLFRARQWPAEGADRPAVVQHRVHMVMCEWAWSGPSVLLRARRMGVTAMGFDLLRDQGVSLVHGVAMMLATAAGQPSAHALAFAWALRKGAVVLTASRSVAHMKQALHDIRAPMARPAFVAADSLAWLTAWCPPCASSSDGFGIFDGLYQTGATWQRLLRAGLAKHCTAATAECRRYTYPAA